MKIVALPAGRQHGIRGAVVNVPAQLNKMSSLLPRVPTDAHILSLKLKRKTAYSSYYMYEYIRPTRFMEALRKLKEIHPSYQNLNCNEHWESVWEENDREVWSKLTRQDDLNSEQLQSIRTGSLIEPSDSNQSVSEVKENAIAWYYNTVHDL